MINYELIHQSIEHYQKLGYGRIESPWMVSSYVDSITRPPDIVPYYIESKDKTFVASGEQSLLYLNLKNHLVPGSYQTVTPCMRNESFDFTHTKYFIKNELMVTDITTCSRLEKVVSDAYDFYKQLFDKSKLEIVQTTEGFDIEYNKIELGSYGIRECEFLKWIFGTGCAEPRTSSLIKNANRAI